MTPEGGGGGREGREGREEEEEGSEGREEGEEEEAGQTAGSAQEGDELVHDLDERHQGEHQPRQPGSHHRGDCQEGRRAVEGARG